MAVSKSLLRDFRGRRLFCDVTLACRDSQDARVVKFKAHKVVLASASEFFEELLTDVDDTDVIFIDSISAQDLEVALDFIYGIFALKTSTSAKKFEEGLKFAVGAKLKISMKNRMNQLQVMAIQTKLKLKKIRSKSKRPFNGLQSSETFMNISSPTWGHKKFVFIARKSLR